MRLINPKVLEQFWLTRRDAEKPLTRWYQTAKQAEWHSPNELRNTFAYADPVPISKDKTATVFNIGGNKYRLITVIHYKDQAIIIKEVLTHQEYDTGNWKRKL